MLNVTGVLKVFDIVDSDNGKTTQARGVYGIPPRNEGGEWENDFINIIFVGKAADAMAQIEDKTEIFIKSSSLRNKNYTAKNGDKKTWTEIKVFDFCTKAEALAQGLIQKKGSTDNSGAAAGSMPTKRGNRSQGNGQTGSRRRG